MEHALLNVCAVVFVTLCLLVTGMYFHEFLTRYGKSINNNLLRLTFAVAPGILVYFVLLETLENTSRLLLKVLALTLATMASSCCLFAARTNKYPKKLLQFYWALKYGGRCPNCGNSFSQNGKEMFEIQFFREKEGAFIRRKLTICRRCLDAPGSLNKEKISSELRKRGYDEAVIKYVPGVVDGFLRREVSYVPRSKPSK